MFIELTILSRTKAEESAAGASKIAITAKEQTQLSTTLQGIANNFNVTIKA